jgi:transcriptional regulator with XRE-family HTH domain
MVPPENITASCWNQSWWRGVVRVNTKRYCSDMEQTKPLTPTQVVAARMLALRKKRGLSAAELARRMKAAGIPWERIVVTKLETGRRASVSVDELLALSAVLNCPPVMLLTADERDHPDYEHGRVVSNYRVTPTTATDMGHVRAWIRGATMLGDDDDPREYYGELPVDEYYTAAGFSSVQGRWVRRPADRDGKGDQDG